VHVRHSRFEVAVDEKRDTGDGLQFVRDHRYVQNISPPQYERADMILPDHLQRVAVRRVILVRKQGDEFGHEKLADLLLDAQS
jgi:hypothetical protein